MTNFIIVEDNKNHKKRAKDIIVSFMMKNKYEFNIYEFDDYCQELINCINKNRSEAVYLLDLELPNGDGIDIARYIRNECNDWRSPIIICTAHTSLAFEAYKQRLQILDFIGKCFDVEENIVENLKICMKMLENDKSYRYRYKNIDYSISYDAINYIQRIGRRTLIQTTKEKYYQNISIKEIKEKLPKYFVISSKGILLNTKNINKINWNESSVYFKDNTKDYLVSYKHKKELNEYGTY
jgi:DNA-binding LytR/AlgR family response regulator